MSSVTIEEAQARLPELIGGLAPGQEVVITQNNQPIAQLIALPSEQPHPVPGRCKGMLTIISEDDEHLKDWAEYLP
jgi:antitoxin (DNA-binding transcriptional repressor) of toxin-antitoxin stability system